MKQRIWPMAAAPLVLALIMQGCGGGEPNPQAQGTPRAHEIGAAQPGSLESVPVEVRLEQLAVSIPDVEDAKCVIVGDMAIVGIDVAGELDRSRVGTVKFAVAEALRHDPAGMNAVVTADMDLYHRLKEIRQDIAEGRTAEGLAEELADIVGRIMPQLPRDIEPREQMQEPKASTQESGSQRAGEMSNAPGGERKPGEPRDNRDFMQGGKNENGANGKQ